MGGACANGAMAPLCPGAVTQLLVRSSLVPSRSRRDTSEYTFVQPFLV